MHQFVQYDIIKILLGQLGTWQHYTGTEKSHEHRRRDKGIDAKLYWSFDACLFLNLRKPLEHGDVSYWGHSSSDVAHKALVQCYFAYQQPGHDRKPDQPDLTAQQCHEIFEHFFALQRTGSFFVVLRRAIWFFNILRRIDGNKVHIF